MDTHSEYTRINVTVHKSNLEAYRALVKKPVSRLVDEALEREAKRARKLAAMERLDKLGPVGSGIEDATEWIRQQRDEDRT